MVGYVLEGQRVCFSRRWRCEDTQPMALTRQRSLVCFKLESDGAESSFLELCNVIACVLGTFDSSISPIFHAFVLGVGAKLLY